MSVNKICSAALVAVACLHGTAASAAPVECGNATLGVRLAVVDPALVGGFCYAQNGNFGGDNFNTADISTAFANAGGTGLLTVRGKEIADDGDVATSLLDFTGTTSGTWDLDPSLWTNYGRVFLAFHFGGAGNVTATNPDSFIVELSRPDLSGDWELTGTGARLNDLSNIYVLTNGTCTVNCGGSVITLPVPEPGSLALAGLALLGASLVRRRKA